VNPEPGTLAKLRHRHWLKSQEDIAAQLRGRWPKDHLFSLRQPLKLYDAIQERINDFGGTHSESRD
jgi:hypothetical protein